MSIFLAWQYSNSHNKHLYAPFSLLLDSNKQATVASFIIRSHPE